MANHGDLEIDTADFEKAFETVVIKYNKNAPEYLNKKALEVIIGGKGVKGAIQLTKRASEAVIRRVEVRQVAAYVKAKSQKAGNWPMTQQNWRDAIKAEYNRRVRAIAYIAGPGWFKAAKDLGGHPRGVKNPSQHSFAKEGYAKKAIQGALEAVMVNSAPGADEENIGFEALQEAIANVTEDMIKYGERDLLEIIFKEASAK